MRRVLDLADKASFAGWLDSLSTALADARDAAIDAVRSRHERRLYRAELGRRLTDSHDRIAALLDAARRGLGPVSVSPEEPEAPEAPEPEGPPPAP